MESRWANVAGTELHWRERGGGRPMVFLHGMADSHLSFLPLSSAFPGHRLLLVDLPGHGLSGRPDASYTPEWYGEVLAQWWDAQGLEDVDLVGHSYGGALAQLLMLSHHKRVKTLTLLAPGGHGPEVGAVLKLLTLPGAEQVVAPFFGLGSRLFMGSIPGGIVTREHAARSGWVASQPGSARALIRTARSVVDLGGQTRFIAERAQELTTLPPTALFWGDRDPIIPATHALAASHWLHGIDLRVYRGVGHFPHLERTREVAHDMGQLLDAEHRRRVHIALDRAPPRRRPTWIRRAFGWIRARLRRWFRRRVPNVAVAVAVVR